MDLAIINCPIPQGHGRNMVERLAKEVRLTGLCSYTTGILS